MPYGFLGRYRTHFVKQHEVILPVREMLFLQSYCLTLMAATPISVLCDYLEFCKQILVMDIFLLLTGMILNTTAIITLIKHMMHKKILPNGSSR